MTTPTIGLHRDEKHRYYAKYPDHPKATGLAMPGVTSVIAKVDKSGPLIAWAKGVTADAALDNLDTLQSRVTSDGRAPTKAWLTSMATAQSDRAKDLGSRVHFLAEQIERGGAPDIEDIAIPFIEAYQRFRADHRPKFRSLEQYVWSPEHLYGGTFDWLADLDMGRGVLLSLADTKSGKGVYAEVRLQLAALTMPGNLIGRQNDPRMYPLPPITQHAVLHIRPEAYERGYQLYRIDITDLDRRAFLGALDIYKWDQTRPSKGEPVPTPVLEVAA